MSQRVPSDEARRRILEATRELLLDRPFAALTVGDVMARAGLTRTVFYRHFDRLAQMAPELLPDAEDPLLDQLARGCGERPPEPAAAWTVKHGHDGPTIGAREEVRQGAPVREGEHGVRLWLRHGVA